MSPTRPSKRRRIVFHVLAVLLFVAAAGHVLAASERERPSPVASGGQDGGGQKGTAEPVEYAPSETVSPDKGVSFPTDI
jgi:hypothetical protein